LLSVILVLGTQALGATPDEEAKLDREFGILNRAWKINVVRLRTREQLRKRAQVKTGLQSYDQQVERAQQARTTAAERITVPVHSPESAEEAEPEPLSPYPILK